MQGAAMHGGACRWSRAPAASPAASLTWLRRRQHAASFSPPGRPHKAQPPPPSHRHAQVGDYVRLEGCRPLSKNKRFKVAEVLREAK